MHICQGEMKCVLCSISRFATNCMLLCSDRAMLHIYIYSDIVLMGIGVLYLWATDSGPSLSWQPRLIVAGNSRRTGGGLLW